jgi:hypothetical protein
MEEAQTIPEHRPEIPGMSARPKGSANRQNARSKDLNGGYEANQTRAGLKLNFIKHPICYKKLHNSNKNISLDMQLNLKPMS